MSKPRKPMISLTDLEDESTLTETQRQVLEIGRTIEELEHTIGHAYQLYAEHHGLTVLDTRALQFIYEEQKTAKLSVIAERIRVPLSTMTGIAHRLEEAGLVERMRDPADGRAYVLRLTDLGIERASGFFSDLYADFGEILGSVGPDMLNTIAVGFQLVQRVTDRFEAKAKRKYGKS